MARNNNITDHIDYFIIFVRKKEDAALARHCVLKAMRADPEDVGLKFDCANIYRALRDYQKAGEIYEQIVRIYPSNIVARKAAAQVYLLITILALFCGAYKLRIDFSFYRLVALVNEVLPGSQRQGTIVVRDKREIQI